MDVAWTGNGGINRLLWAFLGISALLHFSIILSGRGFKPLEVISPIELTVRHSAPPQRTIPRIPLRSQRPDAPRQISALTVRTAPVTPASPVTADAIQSLFLEEPIHAIVLPKPEPLKLPGLKVVQGVPKMVPEKGLKTANTPGREGDPDARERYLNTIRGLIEQQKKYPRVAKSRQFQGKVIVEFVLMLSGKVGSIKVVEGCRFSILNRAAIQAVESASPYPKPPPGLFSGQHSLRIPIVFELI